jgi:hypothetical protein
MILPVRPSARRNSASIGGIFMKFYIWIFFKKYVGWIQVLLKSDRNNGYFTWRPIYIYDNISLNYFWNDKSSDKICRGNQNTHFILFFRKDKKKNMVQPDSPQMTIWRMRFPYWINKATDVHSECVILIAFPLQYWLRESASILRYTYVARLQNLGW